MHTVRESRLCIIKYSVISYSSNLKNKIQQKRLVTSVKSAELKHYLLSIITDYLNDQHSSEITESVKYIENKPSVVLRIDAMVLLEKYPWMSSHLLNSAPDLLSLFNTSLTKLICFERAKSGHENISVENLKCVVRISTLPACEEMVRTVIPRAPDVGKFLSISATVVRASVVQVLEYQREFVCRKCRQSCIVAVSDSDATSTIKPPRRCPNSADNCNSTSLELAHGSDYRYIRNRQEIRIQEQIRHLSVGRMPRSISVVLDDDLVDSVKPGDDVVINGTIIRRWRTTRPGQQCDIDLAVLANEVQVTNDQSSAAAQFKGGHTEADVRMECEAMWSRFGSNRAMAGRDFVVGHMCPLLYGLYYLKLALAMVLCGGGGAGLGTTRRRESHMLLVGEPGTAKSHLLKFVTKLMPRSVLTTGIGSSTAGLTVGAVKEPGGQWGLEAGALVLADGGICCVDELGSLPRQERPAVHEAMEQQTISVAKAGLVCSLRCRCSLIAATNPRAGARYDTSLSLTDNTGIGSPLLSRFDLIFVLLDAAGPEWDQAVSDFILAGHQTTAVADHEAQSDRHHLTLDQLRAYVLRVRSHCSAAMTEPASRLLQAYYAWMRRSDSLLAVGRITTRFLESLIRLSQGHARLMMRSFTVLADSVVAIAVMESSVYGGTLLTGSHEQLSSAFPSDPDAEYSRLEATILSRLGMVHLLTCAADDIPAAALTGDPIVKMSSTITDQSALCQTPTDSPQPITFKSPLMCTHTHDSLRLAYLPQPSNIRNSQAPTNPLQSSTIQSQSGRLYQTSTNTPQSNQLSRASTNQSQSILRSRAPTNQSQSILRSQVDTNQSQSILRSQVDTYQSQSDRLSQAPTNPPQSPNKLSQTIQNSSHVFSTPNVPLKTMPLSSQSLQSSQNESFFQTAKQSQILFASSTTQPSSAVQINLSMSLIEEDDGDSPPLPISYSPPPANVQNSQLGPNIFQDSFIDQPDLTDADFDL